MAVNMISRPDVALKNKVNRERQAVISKFLSKYPDPITAGDHAKTLIDTSQDLAQLKSNLKNIMEEMIQVIYVLGK